MTLRAARSQMLLESKTELESLICNTGRGIPQQLINQKYRNVSLFEMNV
jgi:hypothetical protein